MKKITIIEPADARAITAKTRVAAYCRVSTGMDDQLVSLETQKNHYENLIGSNPEWEYAGLYYDEGISGTSKEKRPALQRMMARMTMISLLKQSGADEQSIKGLTRVLQGIRK